MDVAQANLIRRHTRGIAAIGRKARYSVSRMTCLRDGLIVQGAGASNRGS